MGNVVLNGGTSGQITLQPTAIAGTNTLTLPAATGTLIYGTQPSGTIVGTTDTQTLTNKTIGGAGVGLAGSTSGTVTLKAAAVAGSNTVTIAGQTGTLNADGPAFHTNAAGTQTLTALSNTKILFATEDFDTNNNFASSTFTPTVAGYYQISASVRSSFGTTSASSQTFIFKNGAGWSSTTILASTATICSYLSDIVYCNGTTDYIEIYATVNGTGTITVLNSSFFSGCLIRGA